MNVTVGSWKTGITALGIGIGVLISTEASVIRAGCSIRGADLLPSFAGRLIYALDNDWKFIREDIRDAESPDFDDTDWEEIDLPHTWNGIDTFDDDPGYYRGAGWYRKTFTLEEGFRHRKIFLEVLAASTVTDVWVNKHHIGRFKGGYTGFFVDITPAVLFGSARNLLAIKAVNSYRPDIPPGRKIPDYNIYGGVCGRVRLVITDPTYIAPRHYFVTPQRVS